MYLLTNIIFLFLKFKAFVWSVGNNLNGKSYQYASNCDFPGSNIIQDSCPHTDTAIACANRCSENENCTAFIAVTTDTPSRRWILVLS